MNIFQRAYLGLNLTPTERAFLKVLKGFVISALLAGATAVWPLVQAQSVNWRSVFLIGIGSIAVSFFMALDKYFTSQGDAPLGAVAGEVGTIIGNKTGVNDVKAGVS